MLVVNRATEVSPHVLRDLRIAGVVEDALAGCLAEACIGKRRPRHTQDGEVLGETPGPKEIEQGGSELAPGQVARGAEDDQRYRWRGCLALTRRQRQDAVVRCSRPDPRCVLRSRSNSFVCGLLYHDCSSFCSERGHGRPRHRCVVSSIRPQAGRLLGQSGDRVPIAGCHRGGRREPRAPDARHVGQCQKLRRGVRRDSAGWAEQHVRKRAV